MLIFINKIEKVIVKLNRLVMILTGVILPVLVTTGVFFRYILKIDFFGVEEIEIYIAIWLYFVGAALASYQKRHITADLTQSMISSFRIRKIFKIISTFIAMVVAIIVTYCSIDLVTYAYQMNPRTSVWQIPLVTEYAIVLLSFLLMSLYNVRDFYQAVVAKEELLLLESK